MKKVTKELTPTKTKAVKNKNSKKVEPPEINKYTISFGTDPEYVIFDNFRDKIVSAITVLDEKDKYDPIEYNGTILHADNVNLEHDCKPGITKEEFLSNIRTALTNVHDFINAKEPGRYDLLAVASHEFDDEELENPKAREWGCSPAFCCYKLDIVPPPVLSEEQRNVRACGGHLHIFRNCEREIENRKGEFLFDFKSKMEMIRMMDIMVGIPFVCLDNDPSGPQRKVLYGSAGQHRLANKGASSGCEYRSLSNYWLRNEKIAGLIYDLTEYAVSLAHNNKHKEILDRINSETVIKTINEFNKNIASVLLSKLDLPRELFEQVIEQSKIEHDSNVFENWGIKQNNLVGV